MGIYIASKTCHAPKWRALRDAGVPILSTWIDEAEAGQSASMTDLWRRCVEEAHGCDVLIAYHEPGEVLKGGFVEIGAALSNQTPVLVVGDPPGSWVHHPCVRRYASLDEAVAAAKQEVKAIDDAVGRCEECDEESLSLFMTGR